jgi:hypothetical protein
MIACLIVVWMLRDGKVYICAIRPERSALSRVRPDGCSEYVLSEVGKWLELFQNCNQRMAYVLIVLILQCSSSIYHIFPPSVVVIWTLTVSCHVLAFELGHGGDQWGQHSPQSRRDSNWVRFLCACETLSIHRPSRRGEEGLLNCSLAVKEISRPGTLAEQIICARENSSLHFLF